MYLSPSVSIELNINPHITINVN